MQVSTVRTLSHGHSLPLSTLQSTDVLIHEVQELILPEKRASFEIEKITWHQAALIDLVRRIKGAEYANGNMNKIKGRVQERLRELERAKRRLQLQHPPNRAEFETALRWMAEQGDAEELDLLRQVRASPPYTSETIEHLFEEADERICERVYDPQVVVDREEAAYQEHRQEWDKLYKGEFIAIHRGEVIDHDRDKARLIQRLFQKQDEDGEFRAYIVEIGAPVYVARGPKPGRRVSQAQQHDEGERQR